MTDALNNAHRTAGGPCGKVADLIVVEVSLTVNRRCGCRHDPRWQPGIAGGAITVCIKVDVCIPPWLGPSVAAVPWPAIFSIAEQLPFTCTVAGSGKGY